MKDIQSIILKVFNKSATAEEYDLLNNWKAESKANLSELEELQQIWHTAPKLEEYKEFDASNAFSKLNIDDTPTPDTKFPRILATAIIALTCLALGAWYFSSQNSSIDIVEELPVYIAQQDVIEETLKDKSTVWINENSQLNVVNTFTKERIVSMEGEVFFNIERDETKPFRIKLSENMQIEVLGTSFNVIDRPDKFEIWVETGKVALYAQNRKIELERYDFIQKMDSGELVVTKLRNNNYSSWTRHKLVFSDTHIKTVIEDLAKHYSFDFKMSNEIMSSKCTLSSSFQNESLTEILEELKAVLKLEYEENNGVLVFSKVRC